MIKWKKCPSIMTGGKTYFYNANYQGNKISIVWNRRYNAYSLGFNDKHYAFVNTISKGKKLALEAIKIL